MHVCGVSKGSGTRGDWLITLTEVGVACTRHGDRDNVYMSVYKLI